MSSLCADRSWFNAIRTSPPVSKLALITCHIDFVCYHCVVDIGNEHGPSCGSLTGSTASHSRHGGPRLSNKLLLLDTVIAVRLHSSPAADFQLHCQHEARMYQRVIRPPRPRGFCVTAPSRGGVCDATGLRMCISCRKTPVGPCRNSRYLIAFVWCDIGDMLPLGCDLYGLCKRNNLMSVPNLLANFEIAQRVAYGPADISLLHSARIFLSDCIRKCADIHSAYIPIRGQAPTRGVE